jgi:hypothetical protein
MNETATIHPAACHFGECSAPATVFGRSAKSRKAELRAVRYDFHRFSTGNPKLVEFAMG